MRLNLLPLIWNHPSSTLLVSYSRLLWHANSNRKIIIFFPAILHIYVPKKSLETDTTSQRKTCQRCEWDLNIHYTVTDEGYYHEKISQSNKQEEEDIRLPDHKNSPPSHECFTKRTLRPKSDYRLLSNFKNSWFLPEDPHGLEKYCWETAFRVVFLTTKNPKPKPQTTV